MTNLRKVAMLLPIAGVFAVTLVARPKTPPSAQRPSRDKAPTPTRAIEAKIAATPLRRTGGEVSGTVYLPGRRPASYVMVRLASPNGSILATSTDRVGRFRWEAVPPGRHKLSAQHSSYAGAEIDPLVLREGEDRREIILHLTRGASVAGWVVDGAGKRIPEAHVFARPAGRNRVRHAAGDSFGRYEMPGLRRGRWILQAGAKGYRTAAPVEIDVPDAGSWAAPDIALESEVAIEGVVEGPEKKPVPFATILLLEGSRPGREARASSKGRFRLTGLGPGPYLLVALAAGHGAAARRFSEAPSAPVRLRLDAGSKGDDRGGPLDVARGGPLDVARGGPLDVARGGPVIFGSVLSPAGGSVVLCAPAEESERSLDSIAVAVTALDGTFALALSSSGRYRLVALSPTPERIASAREIVEVRSSGMRTILRPVAETTRFLYPGKR